ncbi:MAG: TetR/AcrR family transcriptional regulator [Chloroflexota bacterium]|jgi:AcrR family transcriptional regulator
MKQSKLVGRRRGANGDARGDIMRAAKQCFAAKGYHRATMREIGSLANVDPSLIVHYFGSKEQLFAESVITDIPDLNLPNRLAGIPQERWGITLAEIFVEIAGNNEWFKTLISVLRAAASEPKAADMVAGIFRNAIIEKFAVLGLSHTHQRATLLVSFMIGVAYTGHVVGLDQFITAPPEIRRALIAAFIQPILTAPIDEL